MSRLATLESGVYHLLYHVYVSVRIKSSASEFLSALFSATPLYNDTKSAHDVLTELYREAL